MKSLDILMILIALSFLAAAFFIFLYGEYGSRKELKQALYADSLTGYPNYQVFTQEATALIKDSPAEYALVYLDIYQFKAINDTLGYEMGDSVLRSTSDILAAMLRQEERFARIYADVFVILLHYRDQMELQERLDGLSARLDAMTLESDPIKPLFCGGVYLLPENFDGIEKACDRANYAKDSISQHFANAFVFYDDKMRLRVHQEKELESSMQSALEKGEFVPYYQPKVNIITEKVAGVEALVRWQHPEKGLLFPGTFLPFYEKIGFIVKIDFYIFERVCQDLQRWLKLGNEAVPVSINFSRRHIRTPNFAKKLKAIADYYEVPTHLLEIEVTETAEIASVEVAVEFVDSLKACGFQTSIDDYGTGYSSISFLQQLPLDALKLDRTFILNAMKSDKARDIMRYLVIAMQRNAIRVICEGVETAEQKDFVISLNCNFVQGFLYSAALPWDEFEDYLSDRGVDAAQNAVQTPIINFEKSHWIGIEDFLTKKIPSWVVAAAVEPGYPVCYISPGFLEGMGYSAMEFQLATGGFYVNWVHPDDLAPSLKYLSQIKNDSQEHSFQYRLRKKDGSYVWIQEANQKILMENGQKILFSVCTNVTGIVNLQIEKDYFIQKEVEAKKLVELEKAKLELALKTTGQAVFEYDIGLRTICTHNNFERYGFVSDAVMHIPEDLQSKGFVFSEDLVKVSDMQRSIEAGEEQVSGEIRILGQTSNSKLSYHWVRITLHVLFDGEKRPSGAVGIIEDINQQKNCEYKLLEETQYRKAFAVSAMIAYDLNLSEDTIQRISGIRSHALSEVSDGLPHPGRYTELLPTAIERFIVPEDRKHFMHGMSRQNLIELYKKGIFERELEYRHLRPDGEKIWSCVTVSLFMNSLTGDVMGYACHRDIQERKNAEKELTEQASRDPLTGVYNRTMAEQLIQSHLASVKSPGEMQAFLMLDLDDFKKINDTYGHLAGDQCLIQLVQTITEQLKEDTIVARMGGDEFVVFLKNIPDKENAVSVAKVLTQVSEGICTKLNINISTSVSIGIAIAPEHGTDFAQLYCCADEAMYGAKRRSLRHIRISDKIFLFSKAD